MKTSLKVTVVAGGYVAAFLVASGRFGDGEDEAASDDEHVFLGPLRGGDPGGGSMCHVSEVV